MSFLLPERTSSLESVKEVITPYPDICKYIADKFDLDNLQIEECNGKSEALVRQGKAEAAFEFVQSGTTAAANQLKELPTGFKSCLALIGRLPVQLAIGKDLDTLSVVEQRLQDRKQRPTESLASKIVTDTNRAIKKNGEEGAEFNAALALGVQAEILTEAADVLFSTIGSLVCANVPLSLVYGELEKRMK